MVERQDVEALAQFNYEAANPMGVRWSQRRLVIRDGWLDAARLRLSEMEETEMHRRAQSGNGRNDGRGAAAFAAGELAVLDAFRKHGEGRRPLSLHTLRQETGLEATVLVRTVHRLMDRGVLSQMAAATDPSGQAAFRLLDPGHVLLAGGGIGLWAAPG